VRVTYAGFLLTLAETLPVAWRRRFPLVVLLISGFAAAAQVLLRSPVTDFGRFGVLVAMYTVAAESRQTLAIFMAAMTPVGILGASALDPSTPPYELMIVFAQVAVAWVLGQMVRYRRRQMAARAAQVQRENESRAHEAAAAERSHMSRELHDVLAHSLSLISIQAGAARSVMDTAPERVRACLLSIEMVSAEAWAETRQFLDGAGSERARTVASFSRSRLEQLMGLIQRLESAGLSVDLAVSGQARPLSADADLCAYRIVQESLTNALRHASHGHTLVSVRYSESHVELEIASEGTQLPGSPMLGGRQHGLSGMHERVRAIGGQLSVDHGAGRFTVRARLPVEAAPR
jgi:signal transduction histidine kinase